MKTIYEIFSWGSIFFFLAMAFVLGWAAGAWRSTSVFKESIRMLNEAKGYSVDAELMFDEVSRIADATLVLHDRIDGMTSSSTPKERLN